MDSPNTPHSYEDNRETEKSQLSHRSIGKNSDASLKSQPGKNKNKNKDRSYNESVTSERARTRTRDPDHDRISDYEKNSDNYYSDEYENLSPSDRSRSLSPCSRSPSPSPRKVGRVNQISSRPLHRKALQRGGSKPPRAGGQQRWGVHSQSLNKDSSPKDLDLVTKRVLSARLLKINEQRNELTELQLRLDQLQKENKVLRQLQHRQERALNKFEDTENEIAQLISRHNNEVHVLRERLRRAQERERATDRRLKDAEEELHRSKAALQKLRRLAEDRQLGEREELARKAAQAQGRLQDSERRVKDLERNMELSSSSFQRQLAAERKKTHEVQEEVKNLREELERVTQKLKERELDTKNIYANRMGRAPPKKETDNSTKKKGLSYESPSSTSSKGVQTEDTTPSVEFPTPPPAVTDGPEYAREDDYLSLKIFQGGRRSPSSSIPVGTPQHTSTKELQERERTPKAAEDDWHEVERERSESEEKRQEPRTRDKKAARPQDGKREEDRKGHGRTVVQKEEENRKRRGLSPFRVHQEPAEEKKEVDEELNLEKMEEERQRKEQLLAKMREIDQQAQNTELLSDNVESRAAKSPQWLSETKNQHSSTFDFPEPVENLHKGLPSQGSGDSLKKLGSGWRGLKPQTSNEDLSFGSYAPSFGRPSRRGGAANQRVDGAEEKRKDNLDVGVRKEKKSNLMQQLFGASIKADTSSKMEVLSPPPTRKPSQQNGSPFPWESSKKKESFFSSNGSKATSSDKSPLQVAENRPTVRAISSFDEDIEEVTL
ncbi:lebercilin isoform X2 [Megalops cyprinoides]|uniref:lebercilin isoform X2 n=1 Tax=Megalops cyprinoides TaxID=118141 RepID=UPI001864B9BD|nr:lebercilin isoform X2 [Megalops cyprinoides]